MASKRWSLSASLSRVWGGTRQNTPTSSSATVSPPNRSRASQPTTRSQPDRGRSASHVDPDSTSSPPVRRAQRATSREEEARLSSPIVPDSLWFASDFRLGAGMVIIQPSTGKVVLLSEKEEYEDERDLRYWFLPKGRKDVGESLEQTALREAYEESGLRVTFLPIVIPHNAPGAPGTLAELDHSRLLPCTESIYVSTQSYEKGHRGSKRYAEYLTFWYVGQIPEDAVVESGTRMADEVNFETHFLSIDDALSVLCGVQRYIVDMAYRLWRDTVKLQSQSRYKQYMTRLRVAAGVSGVSIGAGASASQEGLVTTSQAARDDDSWEDEE